MVRILLHKNIGIGDNVFSIYPFIFPIFFFFMFSKYLIHSIFSLFCFFNISICFFFSLFYISLSFSASLYASYSLFCLLTLWLSVSGHIIPKESFLLEQPFGKSFRQQPWSFLSTLYIKIYVTVSLLFQKILTCIVLEWLFQWKPITK